MFLFWTFKLSFDEDILAFFGLFTVLATFSKIWVNFFPNLLVTLHGIHMHAYLQFRTQSSGLYYKTIVNDNSRVVNKLEASLTDDARVIIYNHKMFLAQATVFVEAKVRSRLRIC